MDLRARRSSVLEVCRLVLRKAEQKEGVTLRESAVKWRPSRIVASSSVLESCIWLRATRDRTWSWNMKGKTTAIWGMVFWRRLRAW